MIQQLNLVWCGRSSYAKQTSCTQTPPGWIAASNSHPQALMCRNVPECSIRTGPQWKKVFLSGAFSFWICSGQGVLKSLHSALSLLLETFVGSLVPWELSEAMVEHCSVVFSPPPSHALWVLNCEHSRVNNFYAYCVSLDSPREHGCGPGLSACVCFLGRSSCWGGDRPYWCWIYRWCEERWSWKRRRGRVHSPCWWTWWNSANAHAHAYAYAHSKRSLLISTAKGTSKYVYIKKVWMWALENVAEEGIWSL